MSDPKPLVPVRYLTVILEDSRVSVEIPWETFPKKMQRELDALDVNDDHQITYTPLKGCAPKFEKKQSGDLNSEDSGGPHVDQDICSLSEVVHSDDSYIKLYRLLWGYAGASPYNDRWTNRATLKMRTHLTMTVLILSFHQFCRSSVGPAKL